MYFSLTVLDIKSSLIQINYVGIINSGVVFKINISSEVLVILVSFGLLLPEPGIFNEDLLQYPVWVKALETLIEGQALRPSQRLHFLGRCVGRI